MAGAAVENPAYPWDVLQADAALQFYPWRDLVFTSWQSGTPPYYNPYQLAGVPLLTNSQSGGFYPLHILVGLLHLPTSLGLTLLALLHLAWAGIGVDRLARRFGAHPMGALMGGISFTLSPFMLGWAGLASVITTVAWIPWVLCFVCDVLSPKDENPRWGRSMVLLALSTGMMVLAGHLQFVAFGGLAAAVLAICMAIANRPGLVRVGATVGGLVLGILLAGPQLKPVLEFSQYSHRKSPATSVGFAAYQDSAIKSYELGNIVNPVNLGNPREFAGETGVSTYWPGLAKRGANWTESAIGPGAMVMACLCLLPLVRKKIAGTWPLMAVGLLGLLIAFGTPFNAALYYGVPGWSATGSPGRAIVLFVLAACVMGAQVVGHIAHRRDERGTIVPFSMRALQYSALAFAFITFGSFAIGQKGAIPMEGVPPEIFKIVLGAATAGGLMITFILAILCVQPLLLNYYYTRMKPSVDLTWTFPAAALGAALLTGVTSIIPTGDVIEGPKGIPAQSTRVAYTNDNWELLTAANATMPPNLSTIRRELDVSGYDSLLHKDVQMWMSGIDGDKDPAPPANGNMMFVKASADKEKLSAAGVETYDGQVMQTLGRASLKNGAQELQMRVMNQTLRSVTVAVDQPGELTLRDHNLGGWTATANGQELKLKPGPWLIVDVPANATSVTFSYTPPGVSAGIGMFVVAAILLIGIGFRERKAQMPVIEPV